MDSKFYANRFTNQLVYRVDQLIEFPESGRIVPEKEDPAIRELIEGNTEYFIEFLEEILQYFGFAQYKSLRIHNSSKNMK